MPMCPRTTFFWPRFYIMVLGIAFFLHFIYFFQFLFGVLSPCFYLDFYFPFLFGIFNSRFISSFNSSFNSIFNSSFNLFSHEVWSLLFCSLDSKFVPIDLCPYTESELMETLILLIMTFNENRGSLQIKKECSFRKNFNNLWDRRGVGGGWQRQAVVS